MTENINLSWMLNNLYVTLQHEQITYRINFMKKVIIYARVSTTSQEYDRQLEELRAYCKSMGYEVVKEFAETASGAKKAADRVALSELLNYVDTHKVDKVVIFECSRLSRRVIDFLEIIDYLTARKVSVYILQNGLETLLPNNQPNPIAQLALGILAQFNNLERTLIRARMQSGYNHYRDKGGKVGRKEGYRKSLEQYKQEYSKDISLIKKGVSYRNINAITGTSLSTLTFLNQQFVKEDKKM